MIKIFIVIFFSIGLVACSTSTTKNTPHKDITIIAHRGSSGYVPEHTLEGVAMAHAFNVDFIEPDVVMSKDGHLIVLHDHYLDTTTDVAKKFPWRNRADGRYYAIDFTLDEIKSLYVFERLDESRKSVAYPNRFPHKSGTFRVPTLDEVIELVQGLNHSRKKNIGLYIEPKMPTMHRKVGKDIMTALYAKLKKYNLLNANIIVQCFDSKALQDFRQKYNPVFPLVQLIGENEWLESADDFAAMKKADGIRHVATYAQGIGVWIPHLITYKSGVWTASGLAELAKNNGLMVHAYTLRPDALPDGVVDGDDYLDKIINLGGADGIFSDQPDILLK